MTEFLLKDADDEEMCFAAWSPSRGRGRTTAIIAEAILPKQGERERHGNVSAMPGYVDRAKEHCRLAKKGLAMIHTHPDCAGPQRTSAPDLHYEQDILAREVFGVTGLPFVGMTLSGDRVWSARFYPKPYKIRWCPSVRIVGRNLAAQFNPRVYPPPKRGGELVRTVSIWGPDRQADLMRLKVGIIGTGSVGAAVGEILARMGIGRMLLMEYDAVKLHNLDRLVGACAQDIGELKADVVARNLKRSATNGDFQCDVSYNSIVEDAGLEEAKDCDVLFCCVDRPWPRQVLNHIAYSCLIPVIDGGVSFRTSGGRLVHGVYGAHTVGPGRACMECLGALDPAQVQQDRQGLFDDPRYIQAGGADSDTRQNVLPFVFGLAGLEAIQFVELATDLGKVGDLGAQRYNYVSGELRPERKECAAGCRRPKAVGLGDFSPPHTGPDASKARGSGGGRGRRAGLWPAGILRRWPGRLFGARSEPSARPGLSGALACLLRRAQSCRSRRRNHSCHGRRAGIAGS